MTTPKRSRDFSATCYSQLEEPYVIPHLGTYTRGQVERCPSTGKLHWQLYVYTTTHLSIKGICKRHPHISFQVAHDPEALRAYVGKDDSRVAGPFEWGTPPLQGRRSDLESACATIRECGLKRALELHPTQCVKFHKGLAVYADIVRPRYERSVLLWDWQRDALAEVLSDVSDRRVFWYVDHSGCSGKSTLAQQLVQLHGAAIFTNGRYSDLAYAYDYEPIVVLDLPRDIGELKDIYSFVEALKNGFITSTKYESKTKFFKPPTVVVFSNHPPAEGALTHDRLKLTDISHHGKVREESPPYKAPFQQAQAQAFHAASFYEEAHASDE